MSQISITTDSGTWDGFYLEHYYYKMGFNSIGKQNVRGKCSIPDQTKLQKEQLNKQNQTHIWLMLALLIVHYHTGRQAMLRTFVKSMVLILLLLTDDLDNNIH